MIAPSATLAQPLLPDHAADAPPTWKLTLSLLWRSAKPRRAAEVAISAGVLLLLVLSKLFALASPLVLKRVVDTLSDGGDEASPVPFVVLYCGLAVAADGCVQLQSALWGRLSFAITQRVSLTLFAHLHALSLRWHLNRKTGETLTVMNQGVGAVATLLQVATFSISATVLELLLTSAVFVKIGVPTISLCVVCGAALYTVYTVRVTTLRTSQRRQMNAANKAAQDAVVDSLLNFETVKLFANEAAESARYDGLTRLVCKDRPRGCCGGSGAHCVGCRGCVGCVPCGGVWPLGRPADLIAGSHASPRVRD
jgi:ABC-type multidrug transport system fused ATPase/permease subunit